MFVVIIFRFTLYLVAMYNRVCGGSVVLWQYWNNEIWENIHFYVSGNLFYDIALLFLQDPVSLAPNVGVACLPLQGIWTNTGAACLSSGWGKDKFGKEGTYQVIMKKVVTLYAFK